MLRLAAIATLLAASAECKKLEFQPYQIDDRDKAENIAAMLGWSIDLVLDAPDIVADTLVGMGVSPVDLPDFGVRPVSGGLPASMASPRSPLRLPPGRSFVSPLGDEYRK